MVFGEGGAFSLDQARAVIRGADSDVLVERAVIIEDIETGLRRLARGTGHHIQGRR
jgi:hypothetical protein